MEGGGGIGQGNSSYTHMATLPTSMFPLMSDFTGENAVEFMVSKNVCVHLEEKHSMNKQPQLMVGKGGRCKG